MRSVALPPRFQLIVALTGFLLVAAIFGTIGYVSARPDGSEPADDVVSASTDGSAFIRGRIEVLNADSITLATGSGEVTLRLDSGLRTERASAASIADFRVGERLNGTALPHEQTMFVLQGLLIIPPEFLGDTP